MAGKVSRDYIELKKSISSYIDKYPSPTREINRIRLQKLTELDKDSKEYAKLRDILVLSNGGFAMKYVMRYHSLLSDEASIAELFQEATIGIIETIDTFDVTKKTSFTTYAYFHIRKRIIDFIKHNKLVRAPRDIARNMKHVSEIQGYLLAIKSREPTAYEIKRALNKVKGIKLKESVIDNILVLLELNSSGYEDSFVSEYKDQISHEDDAELFRDLELHIATSMSKLSKRTQEAIKLRFGIGRDFPHTPEEVQFIMKLEEGELEYID